MHRNKCVTRYVYSDLFICSFRGMMVSLCYGHPTHPISFRTRVLINIILLLVFALLASATVETLQCAACDKGQ